MVAMVSLARPTASRSSDPLTALWRRSKEAGALPILTWYDGADRGELSARTLLTWVTKSVHLLDSEGIAAGDVARLSVFRQRPGHWTSCVWLLSSWWAGLRVDLTGLDEATVEVIGPDTDPVDSPEVLVQCSLTPLATPCQNPVPGAIDNADVLAGPDDLVTARPAASGSVVGNSSPRPSSAACSAAGHSSWSSQATMSLPSPLKREPSRCEISPRNARRDRRGIRLPNSCA